jgi:putative flippase GtrA
MRGLARHLLRFGLVGSMTTGLSYVMFVGLIGLHVHYLLASAAGWIASIGVGFYLNKRFTFGVGAGASVRQIGKYLFGYGLQLAVGSCGYAILMGRLGLTPTLAFLVNLIATAATSFLFMRFVVFRPGLVATQSEHMTVAPS